MDLSKQILVIFFSILYNLSLFFWPGQAFAKMLYVQGGPVQAETIVNDCSRVSSRVLVVQARDTALDLLPILDKIGAKVLAYLARDSYIIESPVSPCYFEAGKIKKEIIYTGEVKKEWKIHPDLLLQTPGTTRVMVLGFRNKSIVSALDRIPAGLGVIVSTGKDSSKTEYAIIDASPGKVRDLAMNLASCDFVARVDPVYPVTPDNDDSTWVIQGGDNTTPLFDNGINGLGQVIGIADSGLDTDACQFRYSPEPSAQTFFNQTQPPDFLVTNPESKVITYYLLNGATAYDDKSKLGHGTHVTGCAAGDSFSNLAGKGGPGRDHGDGMAPAAQIVFQDIGNRDGNQSGLPDSLVDLLVQAHASGARIHVDAYGLTKKETRYTGRAWQADEAIWMLQDLVVVFSSGNQGPVSASLDGLGSTAKNVLTVGASLPGRDNLGRGVCAFSSQGPASDGRLKPDFVAPGVVKSALETQWIDRGGRDVYGHPQADSTTDPGDNNCAVDQNYRVGTSFSAPIAAGGAALVRQYFMDGYYPGGIAGKGTKLEPSAALVKAVMINSANSIFGPLWDTTQGKKLANLDPAPTMIQGWGLLTLGRTLLFPGAQEKLVLLSDTWNDGLDRGAKAWPSLAQGDIAEFTLHRVSTNHMHPLRVTLAWIDPSGATGSSRCLVNDLDLEVEDSKGTLFKGNKGFERNRSTPVSGSEPADNLNTVEQVITEDVAEGEVTLRVIARSVPGNGATSPYDSKRQGFALIAVGLIGSGSASEQAVSEEPGNEIAESSFEPDASIEGREADAADLEDAVSNDPDLMQDGGTIQIVGGCGCFTSGGHDNIRVTHLLLLVGLFLLLPAFRKIRERRER
ncbi:MAG: S8 family serine peptidase [Deltaproteobacteria bacterium]|nr:S8 family serine peptidase [Deltaproteobacteria bacterium]